MSVFRRRILKSNGQQFIRAKTNVFNGVYDIRVNATKYTVDTDSNGVFIWYVPKELIVTSLARCFTYYSTQTDTLLEVEFSKNFDFSKITNFVGAFSYSTIGSQKNLRKIAGLVFTNITDDISSMCYGAENLEEISIKGSTASISNYSTFLFGNSSLVQINCSAFYIKNGATIPSNSFRCVSLSIINYFGSLAATINFGYCPLTLASAKVILNALKPVENESVTFSPTTSTYIYDDEEALELIEQVAEIGWTINLQ